MNVLCEQFIIQNKLGLHARASALLVKRMNQFKSEVILKAKRQTANGKSIMGILMLAAAKGTKLSATITGPDATEAMQSLKELIENNFGEE